MMPVQVSSKHKLVIVPVNSENDRTRIQTVLPAAREIELGGQRHLFLPHQPLESFMLRRLGYNVPSPILTSYEWPHPINEPPFNAQRQTCAMLTMNNRAYVLNGMGTGKTRAILWAWDYLRSNNLAQKLLVVAPLSTLKFTWAREIFDTLPHRKCAVLHGTKKKRLQLLADPDTEIFIINPDGFRLLHSDFCARPDINALCIDELATYRNGGAARTKQMKKFAQLPHLQWVWGTTGAPIPTSPTDAWAQATIVNPLLVPKYFNRFRDDLMLKVSEFKWVPKEDAVKKAFAALQPAVRFTLDDVYELPETITRFIDVEMGPKQKKAYEELRKFCYHAVQNHEITAANAGAVMSKLLQVSTGWVYTREGNTVPLDNNARVAALIDAVLATDRKCLVFVPFKHALAGISAALTNEGIDHAEVSGDTPPKERDETFSLFQTTGKYHALVAHPACMAHGITLTAADTVIWFAPIVSLETYAQANARISRVGQKFKQLILHLQSTPVERRIYSLLAQHQQIQDKLLELFAESTTQKGADNG